MTYLPKVYKDKGGDRIVLASGGSIVSTGGTIAPMGVFGTVFYVDADHGDDDDDGLSPGTAKLTIAAGYALCTDGDDDVLILRGSFYGETLTIAKSKLHVFGLQSSGWDRSYLTRLHSGDDATDGTILVQARDVELAGMIVLGNRDVGKHLPAVVLDGDNSGSRSYVHDLFVTNLTPSATKYNIGIEIRSGDRHTIEDCVIESCLTGIEVDSAVQTTYEILMRRITTYACDKGIHVKNLQTSTGQFGAIIKDCLLCGDGATAETAGIDVDASAPMVTIAGCKISGYTTPIVNGASAELINNYEPTIGGTLINV